MDEAMRGLLFHERFYGKTEPPEPVRHSIGTCEYCGEPIYPGESRYDFDGRTFHSECLENFGVGALAEMMGYKEVE